MEHRWEVDSKVEWLCEVISTKVDPRMRMDDLERAEDENRQDDTPFPISKLGN